MSARPAREAVIVGAGLGGLPAAIALQESGWKVTVLERGDGLGEVETGITLWAFAVRALERLGLASEIEALGAPLERLRSLSAEGQPLSDLDLRPAHRALGATSFDLDRAQLQRALAARLGEDRIRFGARCLEVRGEMRPEAVLGDGTTMAGDLVVGADGVHSAVRRYVAGNVAVRRGGLGVWRGVAELDESVVPAGMHVRLYGPATVFGAARLDARRLRWYAGTRLADGAQGTYAELQAAFGEWAEPARTIIAMADKAELLFHDTPRLAPLRRWSRGRVALVGDAAHAAVPTLGVSGGLALADGATLGATLQAHAAIDHALDAYDKERGPVGRRVQRTALAFAQVLAVRSAPLVALRDRALGPPFVPLQQRGVGWLIRGAEPTRPAQRDVAAIETPARVDELVPWPPPADSPAGACLAALRRATGTVAGPMERHCRRVLAIARQLATDEGWAADDEILQCAAVLHDIGLYDEWWRGGPYVTDAARAAEKVLAPFGWPNPRLERCCDAIERHHMPRDQRACGAEVELIRRADAVDFSGGLVRHGVSRRWLAELAGVVQRRGFYGHVFGLFLRRALERPSSVIGVAAPRSGR